MLKALCPYGFLTVPVSAANHLTERAGLLTHSLEVQDWPKILACEDLEHHGYRLCCSPQVRKQETRKSGVWPHLRMHPPDVTSSKAPTS